MSLNFMLIVLFLLSFLLAVESESAVYLENNAYKGVVVRIDENVPENLNLIKRIEDILTDGSKFLYQATRKRAYLGEVNIVIPNSWTPKPEYSGLRLVSATATDIRIEDVGLNGQHAPYVRGLYTCGQPASFIRFTTDYILDDQIGSGWGSYEKLFVHEWGHLRFGVFDEYPSKFEPKFYMNPNGRHEAVRCSLGITGRTFDKSKRKYKQCKVSRKTGKVDENCEFRDDFLTEFGYASIMYKQYLNQVTEFCDSAGGKAQHNPHAPTKQNRLCDGKSVWEVMRNHIDFAGDKNLPRDVRDTTPTFNLVQDNGRSRRIVLILDISGSMSSNNRLTRLGKACVKFINELEHGTEVGVVWFATTPTIKLNLTTLSNNRSTVLNSIPTNTTGSTGIGAGLLAGLEILKPGGTVGGEMVVVTDGGENVDPKIDNVTKEVLDSQVVIHSVSVSDGAENKVDTLAERTKGGTYYYSDQVSSTALNDAFNDLVNAKSGIVTNTRIVLQSLADFAPYNNSVFIDKTVGNATQFVFDFEGNNLNIALTAPDGTIYTETSPIAEKQTTFKTYIFKVPGVADKGVWRYSLSGSGRVTVTVSSVRRSADLQPIICEANWRQTSPSVNYTSSYKQAMYVMVRQGDAPVLNAKVIVIVERPRGFSTVYLLAKDNGVGADTLKDDGVYSAYFIQFVNSGNKLVRYNLKTVVESTGKSVTSPSRIVGVTADIPDPEAASAPDQPTDNFQRTTTGGSFSYSGSIVEYLPEKIYDLEVLSVDTENRNVTLRFTATGLEADIGTAELYEIRFSSDYESFTSEFQNGSLVTDEMIRGMFNLSSPSAAGEEEVLSIIIQGNDLETYTFALRVKGKHGYSPLSNYVSASMKQIEYIGEDPEQPTIPLPVIIAVPVLVAVALFAALLVIICTACLRNSTTATSKMSKGQDNRGYIYA